MRLFVVFILFNDFMNSFYLYLFKLYIKIFNFIKINFMLIKFYDDNINLYHYDYFFGIFEHGILN